MAQRSYNWMLCLPVKRMKASVRFLLAFITLSISLHSQVAEIDRLMQSTLKMTFPSIYFKHNSTDYATMPYTADSCFKYIAAHFSADVTQLVIWRDSAETEELTAQRIKILKEGLKKHLRKGKIVIISMEDEQKVSRQTIRMTNDSVKINYLLSFNSVMDFSNTNFPVKKKTGDHIDHPQINCLACWANGFHVVARMKRKKRAREKKKQQH